MFLERRNRRTMPSLNTSSLPDLIFTVLFFFMVVTHMRTVTVKVKYTLPQGTEVARLTKKGTNCDIYIGRLPHVKDPVAGVKDNFADGERIQINDKLADFKDITDYVASERRRLADEDRAKFAVTLKADKGTKMNTINQVKMALRRAGVERINYSATKEKPSNKQ